MDKDMFKSYKFKPSDVIEGLNRYFAESKAFRYRRVPLEIRRGVCYNNPDCVKDIMFTNNRPECATKSGWRCWNHYIICDPEEVVGVAINWLREEHDIFYTPGMKAPVEDFDVDEASKEYEKATRKDRIEELQESRRDLIEALQRRLYETKRRIVALEKGHAEKSKIIDRQVTRIKELEERLREKTEENLDLVPVARVREALGVAEDSDIFQCIKYRNNQLETLRTEVAIARRRHQRDIEDRDQFGKRLADIRKAAGMADGDPTDLVKYVETLHEKANENSVLRGNLDYFANLAQGQQTTLSNVRYEILKVYREIFDCSNGDPEGSYEETLQDILTEYQRVLKMKFERANKLEQKLNEIKDICER